MNLLEAVIIGLAILYAIFDFILIIATNSLPTKNFTLKKPISISVIIAARNEADNLKKNLPAILQQNHPRFEVIVVDDQSTDKTFEVIEKMMSNYTQLKYLKISLKEKSSKKNAIQKGIELAKNKHLVFTDADCKPLTNKWLETIQNYFKESPSVVLGYSPYQKTNGNLNKLIRFETYQTAVNYFSFAKLGLAYMGVGRNLGYTKSVFIKSDGFKTHEHLLSGDDDLLINQVSGQIPILCCIEPESFVESKPKNTFQSWIQQKRRHYTTAPLYKLKHQILLSFQFFIKFAFWFFVLPTSLIHLLSGYYIPILLVVIVMIAKQILSKPIFDKLMIKDLWLQSFKLEFQLICLQLYIFSLNLGSPKQKW